MTIILKSNEARFLLHSAQMCLGAMKINAPGIGNPKIVPALIPGGDFRPLASESNAPIVAARETSVSEGQEGPLPPIDELHGAMISRIHATVGFHVLAFVMKVLIQFDLAVEVSSSPALSRDSRALCTGIANADVLEVKQRGCALRAEPLTLRFLSRAQLQVGKSPVPVLHQNHELVPAAPIQNHRLSGIVSRRFTLERDDNISWHVAVQDQLVFGRAPAAGCRVDTWSEMDRNTLCWLLRDEGEGASYRAERTSRTSHSIACIVTPSGINIDVTRGAQPFVSEARKQGEDGANQLKCAA
jgi:hypothetical protein